MRRLITVLLLVAANTVAAQSPAMRERLSGTVRALNGTPEEFEAYAKDAFAKALLDKETPEQRRKLFDSIRAELGTLEPGRALREDPTHVRINVTGTKKPGEIVIEHEIEPPHRLTRLSFTAAAGALIAAPSAAARSAW